MSVDMGQAAVTERLRRCSELSRDRKPGMMVDMSEEAVTRRIREVSELRRFCLRLSEAGREAGLHR